MEAEQVCPVRPSGCRVSEVSALSVILVLFYFVNYLAIDIEYIEILHLY